jgi:4-hydroxymandelate oxidase
LLPSPLFDILFGTYGAPGFETNTINIQEFDKLRLCPRVLMAAGHPCLETTVLGSDLPFPIMIAPTGNFQRVHPEAELAVARAAGELRTIMAVSTASNYSIEEIAAVASAPLWFQLYFFRDRGLNRMLVQRAEQAGYKAIVVTVDNVTARSRERDYELMDGQIHTIDPARLLTNLKGCEGPNTPTMKTLHESYEADLGWSDLEWLRTVTSLPLVVKGIQRAEDAALCAQHGIEGLIVSNHGGHVIRGSIATIEALSEVVDAAGSGVEVYLDGGIRRGSDVLKSLALGARAVFVGRATFWGLTVSGKDGVRTVLEILRDELAVAAGQCGVANVASADATLVRRDR